MDEDESPVGKIILDGDKLGIVVNEFSSSSWRGDAKMYWATSYEIRYADGTVSIVSVLSFQKLIESGRIKVLGFFGP